MMARQFSKDELSEFPLPRILNNVIKEKTRDEDIKYNIP